MPGQPGRDCRWNRVGQPTFGSPMDVKTINLWRQIENGRRAERKRALSGKAVAKATNDN